MKNTINILFLLFCTSVFGQIFSKDSLQNRISMGIFPSLSYYDKLDKEDKKYIRAMSVELRPYVSYNVYKNIFLGSAMSYQFFYSNFYEKENFVEVGIFSRYVIPYTVTKKGFWKRIHLYVEVGYFKTNYRMVSQIVNTVEYKNEKIIDENYIISDKLNQDKFSIPIGLNIRIGKNFYIDFNYQQMYYLKGKNMQSFMCGLGYNIPK